MAEQPGTLWDYGHSTDVLGRVIEVVSGRSLFQFEKERLFDPLGMTETAYFVADAAKQPRVAEPMPADRFDDAGRRDQDPRRRGAATGGRTGRPSGPWQSQQMLPNGGTLDGRRYLA